MKKLTTKLKAWWPHSRLFHKIDERISKRFRKRLTNDQFTILSSNCIGGVIYHRLGKQFLSSHHQHVVSAAGICEFLPLFGLLFTAKVGFLLL